MKNQSLSVGATHRPTRKIALGGYTVQTVTLQEELHSLSDNYRTNRLPMAESIELSEVSAERRVLDTGIDLRTDILKVGHHGSRGS